MKCPFRMWRVMITYHMWPLAVFLQAPTSLSHNPFSQICQVNGSVSCVSLLPSRYPLWFLSLLVVPSVHETFSKTTFPLSVVYSSTMERLSNIHRHFKGYTAIQHFFFVSNKNFPFVIALLSFWNASFTSSMCVLILISHYPSSVKILCRYLNFCTNLIFIYL